MFRYLVVPVLMALLLVPDWASALGRRRPLFARAQPVAVVYPVQYSQPIYYPATPVAASVPVECSPCCAAAPVAAPVQPAVVPERMEPKPADAKPKGNVQTEPHAQPKAIEPEPSLKPVVGTETLPAMKDPIPVMPVVPQFKEAAFAPATSAEKTKESEKPNLTWKYDGPPKEEPKKPVELPKLELPKLDVTPKAELPKLVLPPKAEAPKLDVPSIPALEPLAVPNISKSSPLNAEPVNFKIDRFPVEGKAPASPENLRLVTFYNFSGAELTLTLAGRAVVIPNKHSVEAKLPTKFGWQIGEAAQPEGNIPLTAPGLDVVIGK